MKKFISLSVVLSLMIIMVACGSTTGASSNAPSGSSAAAGSSESAANPSSATAKKLKIAFISPSYAEESYRWESLKTKEACEKLGYDFIDFDANGDIQKQVNFISDAISAGADGIVTCPLDRIALAAGCKKAKDAGVVVTLIAGDLEPSQQQYRDFFCGQQDTAAGQLAAETVKKQFPNGATGVMVMGGAGDDAAVKREQGFMEGIEGSSIKLLDKQASPWDVQKAMSITEDFITKYGDKIQYVYSHWDNGSVGVVQALEAKNMLNKVYIVSVDGCRAGLELVKAGKVASTLYLDFGKMAQECVNAIAAIKNGEKIADPVKYVPFTVITKDNCDFDPGW